MRGLGSTFFRRWLKRVVRAGTALVVALLLAEGGVRLTGLRPPPRMPPEDHDLLQDVPEEKLPGLGFVLRPGARAETTYPGRPGEPDRVVVYEINEHGLRGASFPIAKPAGTFRAVMLGDSITYGTGINVEDTIARQLQPLLAARLPGVTLELLNAGIPATNTGQQAALLKHRILALQPDFVLICTTIVDASGYGIKALAAHGRPEEAVWLERLGLTSGTYDDPSLSPAARRMMGLRRASALADLLAHQVFRTLYGNSLVTNYKACWDPGGPGLGKVRESLKLAKAFTEARDCGLHVVMYPFLAGLSGDYPFAEEVERLASVCRHLAISFTDLLPALAGQRPIEMQAHAHDRHPNGRANALVAAYLAPILAPEIEARLARSR